MKIPTSIALVCRHRCELPFVCAVLYWCEPDKRSAMAAKGEVLED